MNVVPRVATPIGEAELAAVLRDAHAHAFGEPPTLTRLGVAWAMVAFEHARGKAIWSSNIGNITVPKSYAGDAYELTTQERTHRSTGPDDPDVWETKTLRYAAFGHWLDGAAYFWTFLRAHYESVLGYFDRDDADGAARRLSALGYFTALPDPYAKGMVELLAHFKASVAPMLAGSAPFGAASGGGT